MNTEVTNSATAAPRRPQQRRTYHSPRMEDYGAVNELTRSGGAFYTQDGTSSFSSTPPP